METFALIAYVLFGGAVHQFVVDKGLTKEECYHAALFEVEEFEAFDGVIVKVDSSAFKAFKCEKE